MIISVQDGIKKNLLETMLFNNSFSYNKYTIEGGTEFHLDDSHFTEEFAIMIRGFDPIVDTPSKKITIMDY